VGNLSPIEINIVRNNKCTYCLWLIPDNSFSSLNGSSFPPSSSKSQKIPQSLCTFIFLAFICPPFLFPTSTHPLIFLAKICRCILSKTETIHFSGGTIWREAITPSKIKLDIFFIYTLILLNL
jgi:hypothetical protein